MTSIILFFVLAFVASWLITGMAHRYAITRKLLDIPNERSSHIQPTPRGGGLGIVFAFVLFVLVAHYILDIKNYSFVELLPGLLLVAIIGFVDDHMELSVSIRLLVQMASALLILYFLPVVPGILIYTYNLDLWWIKGAIFLFYLVWMVNLYNFMDGINGIAAIQAITVTLSMSILIIIESESQTGWLWPALTAATVAGFLIWNFPVARVFMGDVGSGFLGLLLGTVSLISTVISPALFWSFIILMGVFLVDATYTLVSRVVRNEKFYQAHRSHAYQHAALRWGHIKVTMTVALVNLFWLFPLSYVAVKQPKFGIFLWLISFVPLLYAAIILGAGKSSINYSESR